MPSGPGVISDELIAEIASIIGERAKSVILTSRSNVDGIVDQYRAAGVSGIQICEWLDGPLREQLRTRLPDAFLMQVVHMTGPDALERAVDAQQNVDALLLDSGTLTGSRIELGGTGRVHDWDLSATIVQEVAVPVFLAGGLNPHNVAQALRLVSPAGVDICSGLRRDGRLQAELLKSFLDSVSASPTSRPLRSPGETSPSM
jgi:phosphoribosylanthranilate isomerase